MSVATTEPLARTHGLLAASVAVNDLRSALTWARQGISRRPAMAVLQGVLLEAHRGELRLTGYDYTALAQTSVLAPGARLGRALAPAAALARMIGALPAGSQVRLIRDGDTLEIVGGNAGGEVSYRLPLLPLDDYPDLPVVSGPTAQLTGENLTRIARPVVAAGRDYTLPVLTALVLEPGQSGGVAAVATDRYRLCTYEDRTVTWPFATPLQVPAWLLSTSVKAFRKERTVEMRGQHDEWVSISAGPRVIAVRAELGAFPKWRSILSGLREPDATLTVDRDALIQATTSAAAAGLNHTPSMLELSQATCTVSVGSQHEATAEAVIASARFNGDPRRIGLNPRFLLDGLRTFQPGDVQLHVSDPQRPVFLTSPGDPDLQYLLMPKRLAS